MGPTNNIISPPLEEKGNEGNMFFFNTLSPLDEITIFSTSSLPPLEEMQSTTFTLSPSPPIPFSKSFTYQHPIVRFKHRSLTTSDAVSGISASSLPRQSWTLSPTTCTIGLSRARINVQVLGSGRRVEAKAATSAPEGADVEADPDSWRRAGELFILLGLFYLLYYHFIIYVEKVLNVFPYPVNVTLFQFAVGSVLVLFSWTFNLYKRPKLSRSQLVAVLPLAVTYTLSSILTNVNLWNISFSFIFMMATEPFLSVILCAAFLREVTTLDVVLSLFTSVAGVALVLPCSFDSYGFGTAIAYILTNQYRIILSKKLMVDKEESIDNVTLFSVITVMSFFLLLPATFFMEGFKYAPPYLQSIATNRLNLSQLLMRTGVNLRQMFIVTLLAALCFNALQQVSYLILHRVSPVTHSVVNIIKRVVVIVVIGIYSIFF